MEFLLELILWPIVGILEAIAGLLWPSEDPNVRRLQRICLAILVVGFIVAGSAFALAYLSPNRHVFTLIGIASACFIGSGALGNRIERRCKAVRSGDR